jgi:putative flippase GtrA
VRLHAVRESWRLVRFGIVGAGNTLVTLAVFAALGALGLDAAVAAAIAFAAGAVNSFLWNRGWTFRDLAPAPRAWLRFAALQGLGSVVSAAGVGALHRAGWGRMSAECAILPGVTLALYCLQRLLVFRTTSATPV